MVKKLFFKIGDSMRPVPMTQLVFETVPLESPFAWKSESFHLTRKIQFFPEGSNCTISFTAQRKSKILGYIPILGSIIGIYRIYNGIREYQFFNNTHLHSLSKRSVKWIVRGTLETIPLLGGIICMIIDFIATMLNKSGPNYIGLEDDTPCGHCYTCKLCKC